MTKDALVKESLQLISLLPASMLCVGNNILEATIAQMSDVLRLPMSILKLSETNEEILIDGWLNACEMQVRVNFMWWHIAGTIMDGSL